MLSGNATFLERCKISIAATHNAISRYPQPTFNRWRLCTVGHSIHARNPCTRSDIFLCLNVFALLPIQNDQLSKCNAVQDEALPLLAETPQMQCIKTMHGISLLSFLYICGPNRTFSRDRELLDSTGTREVKRCLQYHIRQISCCIKPEIQPKCCFGHIHGLELEAGRSCSRASPLGQNTSFQTHDKELK